MYTVSTIIEGVSPLLQHRFPMPDLDNLSKGAKKSTGSIDYTQEWKEYFYADSEERIFQPASHLEGALIKAAVNFKIQGKRGKTYKDLFKAAVFVEPDRIYHNGFTVPDELDGDADKDIYLDVRPVVVNRARVVRLRPAFKPGWKLEFELLCNDDEIHHNLLQDVLDHAGKTVGIGDYRPRFGRFNVTKFEVHD